MPKTAETTNLTYDFNVHLKGTFLGAAAKYALSKDEQACQDFLWMIYEQLTSSAAHATYAAIGSTLADALKQWVKPRLYDKYRDAHFPTDKKLADA